jgi:DNA-binding CsgD family transcriptional regulator
MTLVATSNSRADGHVGPRATLQHVHRPVPKHVERRFGISDNREPVSFVIGIAATSAKCPSELHETVWLVVSSENASAPEIGEAVRSATPVIIKTSLQDRLRDILQEIATDVEERLRPAPMAPASDIRSCLGSLMQSLTPRQIQVVQMVANGASNKVIARTLGVSPGTVKVHIHTIFQALNVSNRTQLATLNSSGHRRRWTDRVVQATR